MTTILLILLIATLLAVRSPNTQPQAVDGWQSLHKEASVRTPINIGLLYVN